MAIDNAALQFRIVEVEEFCDPVDVGIAGAGGVVFEFDGVAILVEEFLVFWRIGLCHFVPFCGGGCIIGT